MASSKISKQVQQIMVEESAKGVIVVDKSGLAVSGLMDVVAFAFPGGQPLERKHDEAESTTAAHHALAISSVADFDERVPLHLAVAAKHYPQEISEADIQLAIEAHTMRTDSQPQSLKDLHARADLINAQDLPLSNVLGIQLPPPHMRGVVSTPGPLPPSSVTGRSALAKAAAADLKEAKGDPCVVWPHRTAGTTATPE